MQIVKKIHIDRNVYNYIECKIYFYSNGEDF